MPLYFRERGYWLSFGAGLALLVAGIEATSLATAYATLSASDSVTDIILSNTPVYDVDILFVYGALAMVLFIAGVLLSRPRRLPFALKAIGVFALVRAVAVSLTHLRPFPDSVALGKSFFTTSHLFTPFFTGDDLFFSGHTGLPFLLALVYWDTPWLRYTFLVLSAFFGAVVLLGHLHYSIDVFSAYFIVYGTFVVTKKIFSEE